MIQSQITKSIIHQYKSSNTMSVKGQLNTLQIFSRLQGRRPPLAKGSKVLSLFALASLVSGVNWYMQNQILLNKNEAENNLIRRVLNDQKGQQFITNFDKNNAHDWNCKKITLNVQLEDGRFIIKRNRGNDQGYFVFAPVVIQKASGIKPNSQGKIKRKFMVNMGWIPKSSKHMILKTCEHNALGQSEVQNYLSDYSPIVTIQAYVRTGEEQNKARGWTNFIQYRLFKFINLSFLARTFRFSNVDEASTVYFDRIASNDEESENLPLPISKQQLIADLKDNIAWNEKQANKNINYGFLGSYATALLLALF